MEQFDRFEATFLPQRTDDMKEAATTLIGKRLEWEAGYVIEATDGERYAGQFACILLTPMAENPGFVWAPECDLADIESLNDAGSRRVPDGALHTD